jgi:hypothetical protein
MSPSQIKMKYGNQEEKEELINIMYKIKSKQ